MLILLRYMVRIISKIADYSKPSKLVGSTYIKTGILWVSDNGAYVSIVFNPVHLADAEKYQLEYENLRNSPLMKALS